MDKLTAGVLAGLIATAPMSVTMLLLHKAWPETREAPLPPEEVTAEAAEGVGVRDDLGEPGLQAATVAGHFAYGAAAGALYALAVGTTRQPLAVGVGAGLALWTVSYFGWVPALGLMAPAHEQPAERNTMMIAAHVVWGATTGLLVDAALRDGPSPSAGRCGWPGVPSAEVARPSTAARV